MNYEPNMVSGLAHKNHNHHLITDIPTWDNNSGDPPRASVLVLKGKCPFFFFWIPKQSSLVERTVFANLSYPTLVAQYGKEVLYKKSSTGSWCFPKGKSLNFAAVCWCITSSLAQNLTTDDLWALRDPNLSFESYMTISNAYMHLMIASKSTRQKLIRV